MKITKRTMQIMKQFSQINQSLLVKEGNVLSTMAVAKNILAESEVEETFPTEFAIYNLNEFLASISLFDSPELEFHEKYVVIREEGKKKGGLKYFFCHKALIVYPTKKVVIPDDIVEVRFSVTEAMLSKINKAGSVLGVLDLAIVGDKEGISLIVKDKKNDSSNDFEVQVTTEASHDFTVFFKLENLKLLPGDYDVKITNARISMFTSADGKSSVAIALEA